MKFLMGNKYERFDEKPTRRETDGNFKAPKARLVHFKGIVNKAFEIFIIFHSKATECKIISYIGLMQNYI